MKLDTMELKDKQNSNKKVNILKEKKQTKENLIEAIKTIVAYLLPLIVMYIVEYTYALAVTGRAKLFIISKAFMFECLVFYLIYIALICITKKTGKATLIFSTLILLISIINKVKIAFTGETLFLTDILYLNSSDELINIIHGTFFETIAPMLKAIIIEIIAFAITIFIEIKCSIEIKERIIRIPLLLVCLTVLTIIFIPTSFTTKFLSEKVYLTEKRKNYNSVVTSIDYDRIYGVFAGMYGNLLESRVSVPEDYNEEKVDLTINQPILEEKATLGTPNIIVVFSESFWDIGQLEEVKFDKEVAKNFNKLKEEGLFFNMISPSYGRISANVEFEFLTGANMMYFNNGYVPYMQLYTNDSYFNRPSIIKELQNNGYKTKISTCASPMLFNCGNFYRYLAVDDTEFVTDVKRDQVKGQYISDEAVTDKIIEEFEKKNKGQKLFYMTLTMQAHMPYPIEKYDKYDIDIIESDLPDELNETLKSYAQGVYDADKQLARLYDYIKTYEEPTIIVFYGDHLPYLSNGKMDAIKELKFFNTEDNNLNNYRKYNTQSLLLANFELDKEKEIRYLGPDLLSTYILNKMDLKLSNYYRWLYTTMKTIGASNFLVSVDQNGKLYDTNKLEGELLQEYKTRKNIQYKLFVK